MTSTVVSGSRAIAARSDARSGTNTSVPAGASTASPATVNSALPEITRYSSSWAPAPAPVSLWRSIT